MKIEIKVRAYSDPTSQYTGTDVADATLTLPDGLLPEPVIAQLGAKLTKVAGELIDDAIQTTTRRGVQVISVDMADIRKALEHPVKVEAEELDSRDPRYVPKDDEIVRPTADLSTTTDVEAPRVASKAH